MWCASVIFVYTSWYVCAFLLCQSATTQYSVDLKIFTPYNPPVDIPSYSEIKSDPLEAHSRLAFQLPGVIMVMAGGVTWAQCNKIIIHAGIRGICTTHPDVTSTSWLFVSSWPLQSKKAIFQKPRPPFRFFHRKPLCGTRDVKGGPKGSQRCIRYHKVANFPRKVFSHCSPLDF